MTGTKKIKVNDCDECPFNHEDEWCVYYKNHIRTANKPRYCKVVKVSIKEKI